MDQEGRHARLRHLTVAVMQLEPLLRRCRFPEGTTPLALGVSGGADSTAMALLAAELGREMVLWHVDHGLGPQAATYVDMVETLAERLGAPLELRSVEIADGSDLEARARSARYAALPDDVCVAHTADDRAATILFNLFRGGGLAGVAASFERVNRPLIGLRRAETVAVCRHIGVPFVDDPMNDEDTFTRVAVRRRLMPLAAEIFGRDPVPLLNRHADTVADALAVVRLAAAAVDATDVHALREAPMAVASEALRMWIRDETGSTASVDMASIERVMGVARGEAIATEVVGGHRVARTAGRLRLERAENGGNDPAMVVQ